MQTLDFIWPKDENLWVFGSNNGRKIDGNPKALYDKLSKDARFRCYYVTNDSNPNYTTLRFKSFKPLFIFLRAGNVVLSHGLWDLGYLLPSSRKRVIETWHGVPLKRIGFELPGITKKQTKDLRLHADLTTHFLVSSPYCRDIFVDTLRIPKQKFLLTGQARNDGLATRRSTCNVRKQMHVPADARLVLYAPTFRKNGDLPFFRFPDFDPELLQQTLEKDNTVLLLRPHIDDRGRLESFLRPNIRLYTRDQQAEINETLAAMDALITDYSSLFIDFLMLNRPIYFTCYDFERYAKEERGGFTVNNYLDWIPGPNVQTQEALLMYLRRDMNRENDAFQARRQELKKKFHAEQTEDTAERLLSEIGYINDSKKQNRKGF